MKSDKKRLAIIIVTVFLALSLSSCTEVLQRLSLVNCKFSFHNISPRTAGLTSLELALAIKIDNPNAVKVIFDRLGFEFFINNNRIFQGTMSERLEIPSRESSILEHVISISYMEAGLALVNAVKEGKAAYRLTGNAEFESPLGPLVFPVDIVKGEI